MCNETISAGILQPTNQPTQLSRFLQLLRIHRHMFTAQCLPAPGPVLSSFSSGFTTHPLQSLLPPPTTNPTASHRQALQAQQTKGDGGNGDGTASGNSNTGGKLGPCTATSPPHSQEEPTTGPNMMQKPSTTTTNSLQLPPSSGRRIILPSGIGTCVLSNVGERQDVRTPDPLHIG